VTSRWSFIFQLCVVLNNRKTVILTISFYPFTSYTVSHKNFNDKDSCLFLRKLQSLADS